MISRAATAAFVTILAFGAPVAALGQTVADYRDAIAQAPILEAPVPTAEAHCRPLTNYVYTSIPPWGLTQDWILAVLPFSDRPVDEALAAKRDRCLEFRTQAVIAFDDGSGKQIVDPPTMEDPNRAYTNEPAVLRPGAGPY